MDKLKFKENLKSALKLVLVFFFSFVFFVGIYFILKYTGIIGKFSNIQELKNIILSSGFWSYAVFVVLQFLQVTILPLPAMLTTIVGVIIFGPFISFILSVLSILLGSIFVFFLGKSFGQKLLFWAIGSEKGKKLEKILEKGKFIFFLMMLFPFFPDDILCLTAGVINMDFKFFLTTNLITRPLSLFCICFISSGTIIPYNSWGIPVWIFIGIGLVLSFILFLKNKHKIEDFFIKKFAPKN